MIDLILTFVLATGKPPPQPKPPHRRDNMIQTDPRIRALAADCAAKLKAIGLEHDQKREAIYRDFQAKVAQIQEGSADELQTPSADPNQTTDTKQS